MEMFLVFICVVCVILFILFLLTFAKFLNKSDKLDIAKSDNKILSTKNYYYTKRIHALKEEISKKDTEINRHRYVVRDCMNRMRENGVYVEDLDNRLKTYI